MPKHRYPNGDSDVPILLLGFPACLGPAFLFPQGRPVQEQCSWQYITSPHSSPLEAHCSQPPLANELKNELLARLAISREEEAPLLI